jgi:3-oxoacyl-[acyl-carrier protein] reductase
MSEREAALVFGGSRGIGSACVDALLSAGFDVACTATSGTQPLGARGGGRTACYAADVRDAEAVARVFADAQSDFGRPVHAVVANAGINVPPGPLAQFPDDSFRALVELNLVGAFKVLREGARRTRTAARVARRRGASANGGGSGGPLFDLQSLLGAGAFEDAGFVVDETHGPPSTP